HRATVGAVAARYRNVTDRSVAAAGGMMSQGDGLDEKDMTSIPGDPTRSLHSLLADHAHRTPDAPALLALDRMPLTYGQLWAHVDATVRTLNQLGVGRSDTVAL